MILLTTIIYVLCLLLLAYGGGVDAISANDGIVIRGLITSSNVTYVAGQEMTFDALRTAKDLLFTSKLSDFQLAVCRHLLVRSDPKSRIRQVTYSEPDAEGWMQVKLTLPSDLNTGYYYFLWETATLGLDKARTDTFKVMSAAEANAARLAPVQMSLVKTPPLPQNNNNNINNGGPSSPAHNGTAPVVSNDDDDNKHENDDGKLYDSQSA